MIMIDTFTQEYDAGLEEIKQMHYSLMFWNIDHPKEWMDPDVSWIYRQWEKRWNKPIHEQGSKDKLNEVTQFFETLALRTSVERHKRELSTSLWARLNRFVKGLSRARIQL